MKRWIFTSFILLAISCGKQPPFPYAKESPQFVFFKTLADSLGIGVLNPDSIQVVVSTSEFKIWSSEIMPDIYRMYRNVAPQIHQYPKVQLIASIHQAIDRHTENQLLNTAAREVGLIVPADSIKKKVNEIVAANGGIDTFLVRIAERELTMNFVKKDVKDRMIRQKYLYEVIFTTISINEEEIRQLYGRDKTATVRHILFLIADKTEEEKAAIKKKAMSILARAKAGENFAQLAIQYSEDPSSNQKGGLRENFPHGQMDKTFEDASFSLPIGGIDLIENEYGYQIIKVISRSRDTRSYEEARPLLINQLIEAKRTNTFTEHMQLLREKYQYQRLYVKSL